MTSVHKRKGFIPARDVARMRPSATLAAMNAAIKLREAGIDVVDLGAGEPDFATPSNIVSAAAAAMERGETKYTSISGTSAFQSAVRSYYLQTIGASLEGMELICTAGGKQAVFNAVNALVNPGDDVLVIQPYWVTLPEIVRFAGANPVFVDTSDNDFVLTPHQLERSLTPQTRLVLLNSPCNPSGRVIPPADFQRIVESLRDKGIYVISDECYLQFVYPPATVFSAASLPPSSRELLCVAGSLSKTYAMTGWRIGYALGPPEWIKTMALVESHSTGNPSSIAQAAAVEALTGPQDSVREMLSEYGRRRDWLLRELETMPGVRCINPEGAFYAFPDVRGALSSGLPTSADLCTLLLEKARVVVTDGAGFGADGFIRISYATSMDRLVEGMKRTRQVLEGM